MKSALIVGVISLLLFFLSVSTVKAQIVINELMPNPSSGNDWIELYVLPNPATNSAVLEGFSITDSTGNSIKDLSGSMQPGGFVVSEVSNRLNNGGDKITLLKDGQQIDQVLYGSSGGVCVTDTDQTIGRLPDGTGSFVKFTQGSKAATNNNSSQASCNSPTPTPTPSPSPLPSLSPTPSPSPSPSILPSKKPSPTPSPSPIVQVSPSVGPEEPGQVLGAGTTQIDSPSPLVQSNEVDKKLPLGALAFISGGLVLVGFSLFMFFRSYQKQYNNREVVP